MINSSYDALYGILNHETIKNICLLGLTILHPNVSAIFWELFSPLHLPHDQDVRGNRSPPKVVAVLIQELPQRWVVWTHGLMLEHQIGET